MSAVAFWAVSTRIGINPRFFAPMGVVQFLGRHALYALVAFGLLLPAAIGDQSPGCRRAGSSPGGRWPGWA